MSKTMLLLLGIFFVGALSAKTVNKKYFPMNGNAFVIDGSTSTVTHYAQLPPWENWTTFQNSSQKFYSFTNTLELDQIESTSLVVDFDYKLKITGTLNVWKIGSGDPEPAQNITLEINYDPNTQKTSRWIDYYAYSNVYKSEFIIESVILTSVASPSDLYAKVAGIVELNFGIEQTTFLGPVFNNAPLFYKPCVDNATNELILSWNIVGYAEEYELEITFKDNYSNNISTPLPASAIRYDFKENSTRIVTKQNYYRIPLVYERGYLLYRVRAVGMGGVDWNKRIPCAWSAGNPFGSVAAFTNKYGPIPSHVGDKINWQLSTTYSDEGKRKDVVQYYDGLFMNRQTVTGVSQVKNIFTQNVLDNSTPDKKTLDNLEVANIPNKIIEDDGQIKTLPIPSGSIGLSPATGIAQSLLFPKNCTFYGSDKIKEIIAQEVIYDFNGRPALQILPVPTGTHKITYIKKLNKNIAGSSYSWKDFDTVNNCLLTAHPMSDVASGNALGAGVYYSQKNPNKLGYNAFIPDSKGYPFSRVQYTFDNTGRTYRQAGVGIVHALDIPNLVGHETKFYYAKPNQVELDRMFGNEVGYAIRYQKNMVVDPNGQVSVSYLNPEGKTIATALTGLKPDNLIPLDNESNPEVTIHVDLLASNTPDSLEHSLTVNEQFNVAAEAEYKFDYSVNGEKLSYSYCLNNNICLDCIYDLEIKLIFNEACSTIPIFSYSGTFGDLVNPNNPGQLNMDLSCINSSKNLDTLVTLQAGSYTLVKTLKVNKSAADAYVKLVFKDTCQSVLQEFLDEEINKIDTMDCYQADLSPKPMNECDRARYMMLVDVSPGGQYAQYDITNITINGVVTTIYDASNYPLSVFNPANALPTHPNWINIGLKLPDGITPIPDLQSLILNWDSLSFPGIFLQYHPESCMLVWCDSLNFGKDYDLMLGEALTFQAAIDSTLISTTSTDPIYKQIFDNDPFFHTAPNIGLGNFLSFLANPCGGTKSLDELAKEAAYCQAQPASQAIISNMQNNSANNVPYANPSIPTCVIPSGYHTPSNSAYHVFGSDPATKDYEWQNLRNLYLTYKEKYLYESRRDYSIDNGCFNGCIGIQNFWFYLTPFGFPGSHSYPNFSGSGIYDGSSWSVEGNIPINSTDPCGNTRTYYEHKVKRFTNRYDALSHTTTDIPINLAGINLYDPCATEANANAIQPQVGAIVSQYLCDSLNVSGPVAPRDSCWTGDFISMLNQNLPNVTAANSITLTGNQISTLIRDIFSTAPISQIHTIILSLIVNSNTNTNVYNVELKDNNDRVCEFIFSTPMVGGTPKPISTVCCPQTLNANTFSFTITFTDGTTSSVNAQTKCQMPLCPPPAYVLPQDSCTTRTPFTLELFSFLSILKVPGTPSSGLYHNNDISQQLDHMMDPFGPVKYSLNQKNCTLTFSPTTVQSGGAVLTEGTMSLRSTTRTTADIRTQRQADLHPRPKIPAPCTITFSDCRWLSSDATLISIKPFFPNGIANVVTHEFIITYCKGSKPDTFTVKGNSGCFPVNDCKPPYFCNDTLPKLPPNNYNACVESKLLTATFIAYSNYNKWLDSLKNDLLTKYYTKCMKAIETISYEYPDRQFHYTLYYYDQAGNLVRTVPPAGVQLLSPTLSAQIDSDRNAHIINGTAGITAHTLVTNYAYNSLNQNIWQVTPDAGKTTFYFDKLGRIVASQNAKQSLNNDYSYSWYDKLGRIVESGKIHLSGSLNSNVVLNYNGWKTYLYSIPDRSEITFTQYDELFNTTISAKFGPGGQQNLRGRVASILSFKNKADQADSLYLHATHYTYDVTGNVPIVLQDYRETSLGTKAIAYNFDLLTGKVNEVRYEPGLQDEFRHKYFYDDELRLTKVQTSTKGIIWETEAEYFYYKHGPLARTELGQLKVQGLDYIYTLQGWIKAVNGTTLDRTQDAGRDGISLEQQGTAQTVTINGQPVTVYSESNPALNSSGPGYHSLHNPVAADAFGYVLGYYNDPVNPDYTPIDPAVSTTTGMDATTIGNVKPLYNGNISRMYSWLQGQDMGGLGMNYRYDQLNRLKSQQGFTIANTGGQSLFGSDAYGMNLIYDPNGNIMKLDRKGRVTNPDMDKLTYNYYAGTNKLEYVNDDSGYSSNYPETGTVVNGTVRDIDDQKPGNYTYDQIGNLIEDIKDSLKVIQWNLQNKITGITKTGGAQIDFAYDALGNRVYKKYSSGSTTTETYYVRDAHGNTMSTYEKKDGNLFWQEQDLYGNSRLGLWHPGIVISPTTAGLDSTIDWQNIKPLTMPAVEDSTIRGSKQYELSNHLGNVLATISDRRLQTSPAADGTSGITADLITATDYYAFGMQMPGRNFVTKNYRYGFNGKENDNDVKGDGNQQDYGLRIYDPRLGKFLSVDPLTKKYPWYTPYQFAGNKPIQFIDLDGGEENKNQKTLPAPTNGDATPLPQAKDSPKSPPYAPLKIKTELAVKDNIKSPPIIKPNLVAKIDLKAKESEKPEKLEDVKTIVGSAGDATTIAGIDVKIKGVPMLDVAKVSLDVYSAVRAPSGSVEETKAVEDLTVDVGLIGISYVNPPLGLAITVTTTTYAGYQHIINSPEYKSSHLKMLKERYERTGSGAVYDEYMEYRRQFDLGGGNAKLGAPTPGQKFYQKD